MAMNLFDFDFEIENEAARLGNLIVWKEPKTTVSFDVPELDVHPDDIVTGLQRLRSMAANALDSERMDVYFRILDEIERYEAAAHAAEIDEDSYFVSSPWFADIA